MNQIVLSDGGTGVDDDKEKFMVGDNALMKYLDHCESFTHYVRHQINFDKVIQECTEKLEFEKFGPTNKNIKKEKDFIFFKKQFADQSCNEKMLKASIPTFIT